MLWSEASAWGSWRELIRSRPWPFWPRYQTQVFRQVGSLSLAPPGKTLHLTMEIIWLSLIGPELEIGQNREAGSHWSSLHGSEPVTTEYVDCPHGLVAEEFVGQSMCTCGLIIWSVQFNLISWYICFMNKIRKCIYLKLLGNVWHTMCVHAKSFQLCLTLCALWPYGL